MTPFTIYQPSTVYYSLVAVPEQINLFRGSDLFYFRVLDGKREFSKGKININQPGNYFLSHGKVDRIVPIEITPLNVTLPPPERQREKPVNIFLNDRLTGSPAIHYTHIGRIEVSPDFLRLPKFMQEFILLHEYAHFFYKTEEYCDLWAAKKFIERGGNPSGAYYSISRILSDSAGNRKRLNFLLNHLIS